MTQTRIQVLPPRISIHRTAIDMLRARMAVGCTVEEYLSELRGYFANSFEDAEEMVQHIAEIYAGEAFDAMERADEISIDSEGNIRRKT